MVNFSFGSLSTNWKYPHSQNARWNDFRGPSVQALPHPSLVSLTRARPFSLSPTTSKRLLRRLHSGLLLSQFTVMAAFEFTIVWLNKLKFKNVSQFFINNTIISRLSMIVWVIESWIGLLLLTVTDVSTTCVIVIFRVKVSCITLADGIKLWSFDLTGQLKCDDIISPLSVKTWCYWLWGLVMSLVRFDPCLVTVKQLFIVSQINIASRPVVLL